LKPHLCKRYCIPPEQNADFVAAMEDVLDVYCLGYDPRWPQVCMDEQSRQLIKETRTPLAAAPGKPQREDYEYERNGTANLFMFVEPLTGWRQVTVTERRTAVEWAHQIRDLVDVHYPQAERIRLVMDNLNTHKVASLYEAFAPAEARRIAQRLEIHHTPKHGSWLNMAEIELSALTQQCLDRRIPDIDTLRRETTVWATERNARQKGVDWRFTTPDARIKLKRLYPQIQT
jgi:DDE superfamily endonuclease